MRIFGWIPQEHARCRKGVVGVVPSGRRPRCSVGQRSYLVPHVAAHGSVAFLPQGREAVVVLVSVSGLSILPHWCGYL